MAIEARWQSLLKDLDGILKLYFAPQESARKFVVFPHKTKEWGFKYLSMSEYWLIYSPNGNE